MSQLIGKITMGCPMCDKLSLIEHKVRMTKLVKNEIEIEFEEQYLYCPNCNAEFTPGKMMDENLARIQTLYTRATNAKQHLQNQTRKDETNANH